VVFAIGGAEGNESAMNDDRGSSSFFSLMLITIFSKPSDVICFSVPLLRLSTCSESSLRIDGLMMSRGAVCGFACCSIRSSTSDATESTLADSSGISLDFGLELATLIAGVVASCGCASQQKVSRFHNLQLRFSSLRPSSIDSAHFENTARRDQLLPVAQGGLLSKGEVSPVHMPKRFSTFLVSTLCILAASTVKTGAANREGMSARRSMYFSSKAKVSSMKVANGMNGPVVRDGFVYLR